MCRKSKLRKADQVTLGPEYSGSRVSRTALLDEHEEDGADSDAESDSGEDDEVDETKFAELDDVDFEVDDDDAEINSDDAFGESDTEKFESFTFRGSSKPKDINGAKKRPTAADFMSDSDEELVQNGHESEGFETDEDVLDIDAQHPGQSGDEGSDSMEALEEADDDSESGKDDDDDEVGEDVESEDDSQSDSEDEGDDDVRRAELRKIMNEEQKTVVATISQAAKADAEKGNAVRQQRKAFDSLLSVRMVIQKALIATNSMAAVEDTDSEESANQPYEAAEEAAIKLWNTLEGMRHELSAKTSGAKTGQKRKREVDTSTSSSKIWDRMQNTEISMIDNRQTTLEKWSSKVRGSTSLPLSRKLNPTAPQQSITSLLQDQLASSEHLIKRTKMPRSCAPVQRDQKIVEDPNIYDDGNFYQMLLKELVDQRRVESLTAPAPGADANKMMQWVSVKEAKARKNVDTKASKGRKLRFTVHEKLQNFMAPDDRATWEPERIDRFFGTLLGQRMTLVEDEGASDDEDNGVPLEEEGLMLFRSS
jgi:protein AATF/BFR2